MSYMVIMIATVVAVIFVYTVAYIQGTQDEKEKQNGKELETLKSAITARNNADVDKLRKKYKRNSV